MYRVNVLENVINRQRREQEEDRSTFIEKRDKPALRNFCYTSDGEIFCLTMMYFLKKLRKVQILFSRKSRKISLQSKRISKRRSGSLCFHERREIIRRKREFLQVAPNCAAF